MFRPLHTLLAATAVALCVTPVRAQVDFTKEIDQLQAAALNLATTSTDFPAALRDAARINAKVIELRSADDPARTQSLIDEAALLAATGDTDGARVYLGRAVADAMRHGNVLAAADASTTAALLAQQAGDFRSEGVFRRNARSLAVSPELTQAQSTAIVARLYGASWKAPANDNARLVN
jgi:hypothetical protein